MVDPSPKLRGAHVPRVSELSYFRRKFWLNASDEIVDVIPRAGTGLGHFDFGLIIVPRFVTKPARNFVTQLEHLIEHRGAKLTAGIRKRIAAGRESARIET